MIATYSEAEVVELVTGLMAGSARGWYRAEVASEAPSNRGTSGFPDLVGLMRDPQHYTLMVEAKGARTKVERSQWRFQAEAALVGQPTLIVRSPDALLNGLRYLDLLPGRLDRQPHHWWRQWDHTAWPENVNYLTRMALVFWSQRGRWADVRPLPDEAQRVGDRRRRPPWPLNPATWVQP